MVYYIKILDTVYIEYEENKLFADRQYRSELIEALYKKDEDLDDRTHIHYHNKILDEYKIQIEKEKEKGC
jgi:hypothetical protein